ncbi:hypothetical protein [Aeromonas aquatica]|uniref:hypothetical protein n=1 Tax=Aeromonas aquatica TaxID=558964 RepID=UPI0013769E00|nr:hypothetical protein [Aeromonas aquatica]
MHVMNKLTSYDKELIQLYLEERYQDFAAHLESQTCNAMSTDDADRILEALEQEAQL